MLKAIKISFSHSSLFKNGLWGVLGNILQTVFVSLFFVILARKYSSNDFAHFLIASSIYQLIVSVSSMGLGQWFIREFSTVTDKINFTERYLRVQIGLGIIFYLINIIFAFTIYPDGNIRWLSIILGTNIIFDNVINGIKSLNIAESSQKKTFSILILDGFLRLLLASSTFLYQLPILTLSVYTIMIRLFTLRLFIRMGISTAVALSKNWNFRFLVGDLKKQVVANWQFAIIGSIPIIYWRMANILISKTLTLQDVAFFEVCFRVLSIFMILPTLATATIFVQFVKLYNSNDKTAQTSFYKKLLLLYTLFGVICYQFICCFAETILGIGFGPEYLDAAIHLKQMFITMLVFPTVVLQANLIVALKGEKIDMILNVLSLVINLLGCIIGLHFYKSLSVVNFSILASFLIFHVSQNVVLVGKKIITLKTCIILYCLPIILITSYHYVEMRYLSYLIPFFIVSSTCLLTVALMYTFRIPKLAQLKIQ